MKYEFHRDFYNLMLDSIDNNSVTFLLGTRKCGKTVCLHQLHDAIPNSQYIDFKTIPNLPDKIDIFRNILDSIKNDKKMTYLLDEITYVPDAEARICEIAGKFSEFHNMKTKVVFTGSQSVALNSWADRAFAGNAGKISVDFLTYPEFLRYKGLNEITPDTYNQFLYEVSDFYKFNSIEDYLKGCMEETVISNTNATNYLFDNDCDLIYDKSDLLVNLCYQTMFTLHNHVNVETFFKDNKLRDSIIGTFHETCRQIGNDAIASKIESSFIGSYNSIKTQDTDTLKQALVFLKKCGLITITSVTRDLENVPDTYRSFRLDKTDVNSKKDLFKKYNITINHPMFYVQILKDVLKEDMPEQLPKNVLGSIMECHARGLLPQGFEFHTTYTDKNGKEIKAEIDYINPANSLAIEFTISASHNKYFEILPDYFNFVCLTKNENTNRNNIKYINYCSFLYNLSEQKY